MQCLLYKSHFMYLLSSSIDLHRLGRAFCLCPVGWLLDTDWKTCVDIDECKDTIGDTCEHVCLNTLGSFRCVDGTVDGDSDELENENEADATAHQVDINRPTVVQTCPEGHEFNEHRQLCDGELSLAIIDV